MGLFDKFFGTRSQRELKRIQPLVDKVLALEESYKKLTDEELKAKTPAFQARLSQGETLDDLLPEAFAPFGRRRPVCWACAPTPCRSSAALPCIRVVSRK